MHKTTITHDLIQTPSLCVRMAQYATQDGKPCVDLLTELRLDSGHSTLKVENEDRVVGLVELDLLAEQLHLASIQVRGIMEELNPARRFELSQAEAFGIDRLEEGEVSND